jgi:hypothetical protein
MIQKLELQSVINKYYLNGLIEAVKWEIKDNKLSIKFTSPTKEMVGEVIHKKFEIENSNIGISNTSQLLKLLGITNSEILLSYIKTNKVFSKLIISDNQFTVNYTLADTLTIPKPGSYNGPEEYNLETNIDKEVIAALIKAKSALDDSATVVLVPSTDLDGQFQLELVFGGDIEYSNKVSYYLPNFVQKDVPSDFKLGFNSNLLKDILNVNRDATNAKMSINLQGLMKLEFETGVTKSVYYLVQKDI